MAISQDPSFAGVPIFPIEASTRAVRTDELFFLEFGIAIVILVLVGALLIGFSVRYRRGSPARRGLLPRLIRSEVEIGWTLGTVFLALFFFWWASALQLSAVAAPPNSLEIHVLAKQWMWKVEHPDGAREIDALHVPVNQPVRLIMTSQDVIHSFFVPAFRMKKDVLPGRTTETWFRAIRTGVYHLECTQYCGTDHARMTGSIYVMTPADYARWLSAQPQADTIAQAGGQLFDMLGCAACHETGGKRAPVLYGLYGRRVKLSDGRTIVADAAYIRDSILQPERDIVAGYQPIMPSFKGAVSDADLTRLVAYIRSLKDSRGYRP